MFKLLMKTRVGRKVSRLTRKELTDREVSTVSRK